MRLLAIVNRRVAARERSVSPFCKVSFINADDRFSPTSHAFLEPGESVPFEMPFLLAGVDLTEMTRQAFESFQASRTAGTPAPPLSIAELNEHLKRRP